MKTVVYIDVYFILNFAVDLLCIYLCGMLSGKRPKKPDLIASALIGGVFSCAILII
ncbi:MAG: sigma-E processing peptidase SpoIIGA [Clostridia bacterium]|nr:sigma-E processing peptidase SpoIIGA [Clostridia bacterium]